MIEKSLAAGILCPFKFANPVHWIELSAKFSRVKHNARNCETSNCMAWVETKDGKNGQCKLIDIIGTSVVAKGLDV